MNKLKIKKSSGFTLLELLFVIFVMSIMVVIGINAMQQKAKELQVQKTAIMMQQYFEAAMAFYNDTSTQGGTDSPWPAALSDLWTPRTDGKVFMTSPLQQAGGKPLNPWGQPIEVAPANYLPTGFTGFGIITTAGSLSKSTGADNSDVIAANSSLAALVPGGIACQSGGTNNPTQCPADFTGVIATIPVPGATLMAAGAITYANIVPPNSATYYPNSTEAAKIASACVAANLQPEIFVSPVAVAGIKDPTTNQAYPIENYFAYAGAPQSTTINGVTVPYQWQVKLQMGTEQGAIPATCAEGSTSCPWQVMVLVKCGPKPSS